MRCRFPDCPNFSDLQPHHITYVPEVVVDLCHNHHTEITAINAHQARKQNYTELSNRQRWFLWYGWISGRIKKPRITHLDKEWSENYERSNRKIHP